MPTWVEAPGIPFVLIRVIRGLILPLERRKGLHPVAGGGMAIL